jgi:hypothetical protein
MSGRAFFSRLFGRDTDEGETRILSFEEIGTSGPSSGEEELEEKDPQGFTVERAARIIDDLPPDVPRESAVQIVRGTLAAAGIKVVEDLERSTRKQEAKLESEIDLSRNRQQELREKTGEAVRSLEEAIQKARKARDSGIADEEENISRVSARLREVRRVRAFFGFSKPEEGEAVEPTRRDLAGDEMQSSDTGEDDKTQVMRRPGPLVDPHSSYETTDER